MQRCILHVDMDAFFAAVEQRDHPEWRGKPVIVGAPPDRRGVVSTCSYEARAFGVHSAMPSREAYRRCPHAVFVPCDMGRYEEASQRVFAIFERFTPLIEPLSIDEAFLDVTGGRTLFGGGEAIARAIREAIRNEVGLTASVGIAHNKFLAKLASEQAKPDGLAVVPDAADAILAFLAPLPVHALWGVGRVTAQTLEQGGLRRVGDIRRADPAFLARLVGGHAAAHLLALACGEDARPVETAFEEKSVSREHTFPQDCRDRSVVCEVLKELADDVGRRLRLQNRYATLGKLKLRWADFRTLTRQTPFPNPVCDDFAFREQALRLFRAQPLSQPVRLIGFGVSGLCNGGGAEQLALFDPAPDAREKRERLCRTLDRVREQLGDRALRRVSAPESGTE
ncbi:MAG: DNA polymerase IV [Kiritimatiellia bacterium]|nr:DNA polymerase IV [Kiritimatiellia bacterium]